MITELFKLPFVCEVHSEDARVVMRSVGVIPVFAAGVIPELSRVFSKTFEELLEVFFFEGVVLREIVIVVGERVSTVVEVELSTAYGINSSATKTYRSNSP